MLSLKQLLLPAEEDGGLGPPQDGDGVPGGGPPGSAQIQENLLSLEEVVKQLEVCLGPGDLGQAAEGKAFLIYGPLQELEEEFCRLRSLLSQLSGTLSPSLAVPERSVQTSELGTGARMPCSTIPSVSVHPSLPLLSQPLSSISPYLLLVTLRPFMKRPPRLPQRLTPQRP